MKKSKLRYIIRKIIQEQEGIPVLPDSGLDPSSEPSEDPGGGWGFGGGSAFDDLNELDALQYQIAEQFANDQLMYSIFGTTDFSGIYNTFVNTLEEIVTEFQSSTDPGNWNFSDDVMDFEDEVEQYIDFGSSFGQYWDQEIDDDQFLNSITNSLTDYVDNFASLTVPTTTGQPDSSNFQGNYSSDPSSYNYFFQHYQASTGTQVSNSFQNYLLSLCQASPLMLTTVSQQNTLAGELIREHIESLSVKPGIMNAFANDPLTVPFPWCPTMFQGCFPNCLETPWVQYGMNKEEYCELRYPDPEIPETQCTNYLYYSCMDINFLPVEITATSDHGCQDPAANNYKADAALPCACDIAGINDNCPCDYSPLADLQTVDGETELPEPPPPVKEPIKKDIPIEPPRPITPISPKSKETSPKFPTMPKITPSTPINDPKKIRLQELAGIRKRK